MGSSLFLFGFRCGLCLFVVNSMPTHPRRAGRAFACLKVAIFILDAGNSDTNPTRKRGTIPRLRVGLVSNRPARWRTIVAPGPEKEGPRERKRNGGTWVGKEKNSRRRRGGEVGRSSG